MVTKKMKALSKPVIGIFCNPTFSLDLGSLCQPHLMIHDLFLPWAQKRPSAYVIRFLYIINSESLRLCAFILNIWNITVRNIISILFSLSIRGSLRAFLCGRICCNRGKRNVQGWSTLWSKAYGGRCAWASMSRGCKHNFSRGCGWNGSFVSN